MSRKFLGFGVVVAMTAFLSLVSIPTTNQNTADAGLFSRIFGGRAYSGCGGGGGLQSFSSCGGGGGLQYAYSSCGGGGGGLQFAPVQTYVQPTYYYPSSSGCPGGVCPPGVGNGLVYSPTYYAPTYASAPVPLNPGEVYVAGSLREVRTAPAKTQIAKASPARTASPPEKVVAYQITQTGCEHCEEDQEKAKEKGVELVVLNIDDAEDAFKIANLWRRADIELTGTPAYILTEDGEVTRWKVGKFNTGDGLRSFAKLSPAPATVPEKAIVKAEETDSSTTNKKLDRIEAAILELAKEIRESRKPETRTAALN
jgi:glutaredoxin